jgi:tetratricopeptide (TPR) repeat protein
MSVRLLVARFGSPAAPVVMFAGARARVLLEDPPLLFGTLDELECPLDEVRAMSLERRSVVVATVSEPRETLSNLLWMSQVLGADVDDGEFKDDKQHAIIKRPAETRREIDLAFVAEDYFRYRFPDNRQPTREEIARAFGLVGRFDRSVEVLREELRERPDDAPLLFHLGDILTRIGRPEEAIELLQRSAELAPDQLDPRSSLALALIACGRHRDAQTVYAELVVMSGGDFGDWMNLATICTDTGELEEGRRAVEQALAIEPDSAHAQALAATLAVRLGDHRAARKHCLEAEARLRAVDRSSPMYDIISDLVREARLGTRSGNGA